jgi:hypothetical protein
MYVHMYLDHSPLPELGLYRSILSTICITSLNSLEAGATSYKASLPLLGNDETTLPPPTSLITVYMTHIVTLPIHQPCY